MSILFRIDERLFLPPVLRQTTGPQRFEAVLFEYGRGTRGSATLISKGDDYSVFGNFLEAGFQLAKRNIDITLDAAQSRDLVRLANIEEENAVLLFQQFL